MNNLVKFFLIILACFILTACQTLPREQNGQTTTPIINESKQNTHLLVAEENGINAFDLSKNKLELKYEETSFGVFVTSINGTEATDKYFWALYLNGSFAEQSIDKLNLSKGDKIEWKYEKING